MSAETAQKPLENDQFEAYKELATEATSTEDLATLREMAEQDTGAPSHQIEVKDENGEIQTVEVTDIGKGALQHVINKDALAVHSEDWHNEEK